jgi:hypothetical protein
MTCKYMHCIYNDQGNIPIGQIWTNEDDKIKIDTEDGQAAQ